jgi:hypothetical protein
MDRTSGFGRVAQLDVMAMTSGTGVATTLAQELYGATADRFPVSSFSGPCRQGEAAGRTPARTARWSSVPRPPAGHVA